MVPKANNGAPLPLAINPTSSKAKPRQPVRIRSCTPGLHAACPVASTATALHTACLLLPVTAHLPCTSGYLLPHRIPLPATARHTGWLATCRRRRQPRRERLCCRPRAGRRRKSGQAVPTHGSRTRPATVLLVRSDGSNTIQTRPLCDRAGAAAEAGFTASHPLLMHET